MSKAEKLIEKMRTNPRDWRMESIEAVAKRHRIEVRKTGGSHFVFLHADFRIGGDYSFQTSYQTDLYHPVSCSAG